MPRTYSKASDASHLDRPRVRFNWGYWDGAFMAAEGICRLDGLTAETIVGKHFDPFYAHGYVAGCASLQNADGPGVSSDPAWSGFRADLSDPSLIFQIEAMP